jgi:hypoxanthine phosphoribosyltransferase
MRGNMPSMHEDIAEILYHETTILARLDDIAREITRDFRGSELTVVGILNGSCIFLGDLLRRIPLPLKVECLSVASYHGGMKSSGEVSFLQSRLPDVRNRDVLLVDDILDTGRTLSAVRERLLAECGARSVRTCVLLRKNIPRPIEVAADYVAFDIPDAFVVGYGLDYMGHYRNLPYVGVLTPPKETAHPGAK